MSPRTRTATQRSAAFSLCWNDLRKNPGSSVFDLPVHQTDTPPLEIRPRGFPAPPDTALSSPNTIIAPSTLKHETSCTPSFLVISGGTGGNSICSVFGDACYVLPVSDDGGSSSEIIRVLGGPSIGDLRSRLVRLIPSSLEGSPLDRIRNLLAYRLPAQVSEREARDEWRDIVEGRSSLWAGIPPDRKEVIRGFLVYFESEVLRRAQKNFSFRNGSVGNYFLAAARIFFRSLPSAVFLFSSITNSQANILPVLVTNHTVTIAVELENGRCIVGQCNISHPAQEDNSFFSLTPSPIEDLGEVELGSNSIPQRSHTPNLVFSKESEGHEAHLESRIQRLYYINAYGHEIHPSPNPDFLAQCATKDLLVYSCGSLWTSIIPCLALKGVASAIARSRGIKAKILLLNSRNDRETTGYTAVEYVKAICRTLNTHYASQGTYTSYPISAFVTHLVHLKGGLVPLDVGELTSLGVRCIQVESTLGAADKEGVPVYDADCVKTALRLIMTEWEADAGREICCD
ncbi:UPF0052-domain-containing protein [Fomitiporia mediterranea MF3/22]|uniref:UPF0052-domain-containing protein n=1 Tax=Fomitiporia mediterranea (strain MF3/22) TaxID=694068 RepID=UPI000440835D|nr:UPF0052-domain-containing protein [Fomitiporia mediterranea MF3/22]EJD04444.1 UPF0052-domain-containing protein [Fomitiporia mediterranea MF3/22]